MSSRNPFGIGREATNRVNTVKLENRLANQFRKGIINRAIPYYDPSNTQIFTTPIPIPDNTLVSEYIKDKSIVGNDLQEDIVFPRNTYLSSAQQNNETLPATVQYVNSSVSTASQTILQGTQDVEEYNILMDNFSNILTSIKGELPSLDTSVNAIDTTEWAIESKIADGSITKNKLYNHISFPSNLSIEQTTNTLGTHLATTEYTKTIVSDFLGDASINSVGKLATAVSSFADTSFHVFLQEIPSKIDFDNSYVLINGNNFSQQYVNINSSRTTK